jgi:hypothetical protein
MIERHESCWGLSLPAIGKYKIECWFCPPNYAIKKHKHPNQNIKLFFLFGSGTTFHRERESEFGVKVDSYTVRGWRDFGRCFNILRGDYHYFSVSSFPLIFLNVETWFTTPTSAAKDFEYAR